jgi:outer membrane protein assembly factor BamB
VQGGKDGIVRLLNLDNLSTRGSPGYTGGEVGQSLQMGSATAHQAVTTAPVVWTNPADGSQWVFIGHSGGIIGLRLSTAPDGSPALTPMWQSFNPGASPLVANNVLYYAATHALRALDPATGTLLWQVLPRRAATLPAASNRPAAPAER